MDFIYITPFHFLSVFYHFLIFLIKYGQSMVIFQSSFLGYYIDKKNERSYNLLKNFDRRNNELEQYFYDLSPEIGDLYTSLNDEQKAFTELFTLLKLQVHKNYNDLNVEREIVINSKGRKVRYVVEAELTDKKG